MRRKAPPEIKEEEMKYLLAFVREPDRMYEGTEDEMKAAMDAWNEFDREAIPLSPVETRRLLKAHGFQIIRTDFLFIFPHVLRWLRWLEPFLSRIPLGGQYQVLCRRSRGDGAIG
jgi:hypothetical protein